MNQANKSRLNLGLSIKHVEPKHKIHMGDGFQLIQLIKSLIVK